MVNLINKIEEKKYILSDMRVGKYLQIKNIISKKNILTNSKQKFKICNENK